MTSTINITNRSFLRIPVRIEGSGTTGLAFVMHGLGGFMDQVQLRAMIETFVSQGYRVVSFNTTNTVGDSDGSYANATLTNYYEDLQDVIAWASEQQWYHEPFVLAGHSMGGICTALFAEAHPEKVKALAPISTVVSGELSVEAHKRFDPEAFRTWEETGWQITESTSLPGVIKKLKWSHIEDRLRYDLLLHVDKLTMPVLMIVGELDENTPPDHQQILFDALPGTKELHVIPGAPHTFKESEHIQEVRRLLEDWLRRL